MPRQIDLYPQNFKLTNDPNAASQSNPQAALDQFKVPTLLDEIETIINDFLKKIDDVTGLNLLGVAQAIESLLTGADQLFQPIIAALTGGVGTVVADIAGAWNTLTGLVQNIVDAVWNAINQTVGEIGKGIADITDLLFGQHHTIKGHSSLITEIQAALGLGPSDQFVRADSSTLGSSWNEAYRTGGGTLGITSDEAAWSTSGGSSNDVVASRLGSAQTSSTDYQKVTIVVAGQGENDSIFGHTSYQDLICRADSTPVAYGSANYIRARITGNNKLIVQVSKSGTVTTVTTINLPASVQPGTTFSLLAGIASSTTPAWIQVLQNGTSIYSAADATGSNYGSSYRGWGFGMGTQGGAFVQVDPGPIALWSAQDQ